MLIFFRPWIEENQKNRYLKTLPLLAYRQLPPHYFLLATPYTALLAEARWDAMQFLQTLAGWRTVRLSTFLVENEWMAADWMADNCVTMDDTWMDGWKQQLQWVAVNNCYQVKRFRISSLYFLQSTIHQVPTMASVLAFFVHYLSYLFTVLAVVVIKKRHLPDND